MNTIDALILVVVTFNLILGAIRGAAWQILRLASIVLGVWGAWHYGDEFLALFPPTLDISADYGIYVARVVLFLSIYLIMFGVTNLVRSTIQKVKLGSWDRGIGALFGAAKGALYCSVVLYLQLTPIGEIPLVKDHLQGNPEKNLPASVANDVFEDYIRKEVDRRFPDAEQKLKEKGDAVGDKIAGHAREKITNTQGK